MRTLYFPASRAERLIAAGRTALAASSLFAVWIDPTEPTNHRTVAYSLMWAYVVYSALLAVMVWRAREPGSRERLVTHAVDLIFFSLFAYFTEGPTSPTTIYFVFSMVCATLRWRLQGVVWTAVAAIAAHVVIAFFVGGAPFDAHVDTFRIVGRVVYLVVVAALLGFLGAHEERTRREISALAAWPAVDAPRMEPALRSLLEHAATVLGAPRVLLVWTEREEPWQYVADWRSGRLEWAREAPSATPGVAPEIAENDFLEVGDDGSAPVLLYTGTGFTRWSGEALRDPLSSRIGSGPILGVRLRSPSLDGRLFVLGKQDATADDLVLAGAVAALLAARLESLNLTRDLAEAAATEQRIRLARDLHDGVLQSLTGVALRLEEVRRALSERPADAAPAAATVEELQRLLALEQRDLRFFIHELEPSRRTATGQVAPLRAQLIELAQRLELEWGLAVQLDVRGDVDRVPERLAREVYHITREAMVNAVRHGKASAVAADISAGSGPLSIVVADNGCGFPFEGRLSHEELRRGDLGPRTLRERVVALSGTLALESTRSGARLEVLLPTDAPA